MSELRRKNDAIIRNEVVYYIIALNCGVMEVISMYMTKGLKFHFKNEILPKQASENWKLNDLSGLLNSITKVLSLNRRYLQWTSYFVSGSKLNHLIATRFPSLTISVSTHL
jgi:hypothetical protein